MATLLNLVKSTVHCKTQHTTFSILTIFNRLTKKAFAILCVCPCIFGAGGSMSVYLQHGEPNCGCKNLEKEKVSTPENV